MIGFWSDKKITEKELWNGAGPFEVCITWMKVFELVLREMEIDRINSLFTFSIFLELQREQDLKESFVKKDPCKLAKSKVPHWKYVKKNTE